MMFFPFMAAIEECKKPVPITLNQLSKEDEIMRSDYIQHRTILIYILKDIFSISAIAPYLGFKGGTASHLFYELPRFSIDLDFDLLDQEKETTVFEVLQEILKQYGTIKEAQNKRYSLFFILCHHNKIKDTFNIKVEINKRSWGSRYEIKDYLGIPIQVMVQEDITANKLVAMHERLGKANRDIFDVWFFLHNNFPINKQIVIARTGMSYSAFLECCINRLEKFGNINILSGLGELLIEKQKAWVRSHLKDDTLFALRLALSNEK